MVLKSTLAGNENKTLSDGGIAGPMPWVIAIMVFLTILAGAAGIAMSNAASQNSEQLARKITVQILEEDPIARQTQRQRVSDYLKKLPQTQSVTALSDSQVAELLEPWLGSNENLSGDASNVIPLPVIIDVVLNQTANQNLTEKLVGEMRALSPSVRVDTQESWIAPLYDLMRSLILLIFGLVALLAIATSATVVLAVRSALDTHRVTLDIMHLMGSTDDQISRLFQRRVAVDALFGGAIGFIIGSITVWLLSLQISSLGSGAISQISMPWYGWILLALIPLLMALLSIYMARWTVRRAMKNIL